MDAVGSRDALARPTELADLRVAERRGGEVPDRTSGGESCLQGHRAHSIGGRRSDGLRPGRAGRLDQGVVRLVPLGAGDGETGGEGDQHE